MTLGSGANINHDDVRDALGRVTRAADEFGYNTDDWQLLQPAPNADWCLLTRHSNIWGFQGNNDFIDLGPTKRHAYLHLEGIAQGLELAKDALDRQATEKLKDIVDALVAEPAEVVWNPEGPETQTFMVDLPDTPRSKAARAGVVALYVAFLVIAVVIGGFAIYGATVLR